MRPTTILLVLILAAGPAARAQDVETMVRTQELEQQLVQSRQREVALRNELMSMEARRQADNSLRSLEAQRLSPGLRPPVDYDALATAKVAPDAFAAMPDDRLAASNARVRAAAQNRR